MADLDTRNKRGSAFGLAHPSWAVVYPNPDGSIAGQADRQHNAYSYPGILAGAPVIQTVFRLTLLGAGCYVLWLILEGL